MSTALRWVAVLPGSLVAATLARVILGPLNMLTCAGCFQSRPEGEP